LLSIGASALPGASGWNFPSSEAPSASVCRSMLATLVGLITWNAEYAGFIHYRNWNASQSFMPVSDCGQGSYGQNLCHLPDGVSEYPISLAKDACAFDNVCEKFVNYEGGTTFSSLAYTPGFDTYICTNSSVIAGQALCGVDSSGPGSPDKAYLRCDLDCIDSIAVFALPPDLIHSTCTQNPSCIGFVVTNDGSSGILLKQGRCAAPGYFAMPQWHGKK